MKYRIVNLSQIANSKSHSFSPSDYIGDPVRVKKLLHKGDPKSVERLREMIKNGAITSELLEVCSRELLEAEQNKVNLVCNRILEATQQVKE